MLLLAAPMLLAVLVWLREPLGRWWFPLQGLAAEVSAVEEALDSRDPVAAELGLGRIAARDPDHVALPALRQRWQALALAVLDDALAKGDEATAQHWLASLQAARVAPSVLQDREVRWFLGDAPSQREAQLRRAREREVLQPEEARAIYRLVLLVDPGNAVAIDGRRRLLQQRIDAAMALALQDRQSAATAILEMVLVEDPLHPGLVDAVRWYGERGWDFPMQADATPDSVQSPAEQLALAWRGRADEALGRGELRAARVALQAAERLQPGHPDNQGIESRLVALGAEAQ